MLKTGFAPHTELTQSEKLYSLLLETYLVGKNAQLAAVWNEIDGISHRLFYDSSLECFLFGKEPTFAHETFMPLVDEEYAEFYLDDYPSREQFLKSALLAWEAEVARVTALNNQSVLRSDIRALAEAIFINGDKVLDTWKEEVPGGSLSTINLVVDKETSTIKVVSDQSVDDIVVVSLPEVITPESTRTELTRYVKEWYKISPNKLSNSK